jgi:sterol desaturase/sphingolipid hydroxylase (fatty acid hydroxylase superfamily)
VLQKIWDTLVYPLTYFGTWKEPLDWEKRLHAGYLLWCVLIAVAVYYASERKAGRRLWNFLFPREVYGWNAVKVDLGFVYLDRIIYLLAIVPLYDAMFRAGSWLATRGLQASVAPHQWSWTETQLNWAYSLGYFVLLDFSVFFPHWLQHKLSWLWEFHKVHHSATSMTPVTVYRMHPIDYVVNLGTSGLLLGLFRGGFFHLFDNAKVVKVLEANVFLFLFYAVGFNLRHSHVWLPFGRQVSRVFISPAMHQIHHSSAEKHFDKNFGFFLSIWDQLFGTLYIPQGKEQLQLGLADGTTAEYRSVSALFWLPCKKWFRLLSQSRGQVTAEPAATQSVVD